MMAWLLRTFGPRPHPEVDRTYHERAERVDDLSKRLRDKRKQNGFGKMFDAALRAPRNSQGGPHS